MVRPAIHLAIFRRGSTLQIGNVGARLRVFPAMARPAVVAKWLEAFKEVSPRAKAASFTVTGGAGRAARHDHDGDCGGGAA